MPKNKDITILKTEDKDKDITIPKNKTENKDMLDKINDKVSIINETSTILTEKKVKLKKKYKLIYESM